MAENSKLKFPPDFPRRCFISHSYQDKYEYNKLLAQLTDYNPVTFPPISTSSDDMISNKLIESILGCNGLIYLTGGYSAVSFWVAFERDYALRARKPTFAYDSVKNTISHDTSEPLELPLWIIRSSQDEKVVQPIFDFMVQKRFFQSTPFDGKSFERIRSSHTHTFMDQSPIIKRVFEKGYIAVFWSKNASHDFFVRSELQAAAMESKRGRDIFLPVLLDKTFNDSIYLYGLAPFRAIGLENQGVQLYGDEHLSQTNRIDNLIVSLYWLIYQHSKQNNLM